jgi:hydrogenase nickel incorporation protein HypA/HybF
MHEVAAIQGICTAAVQRAEAAGASRITHIELTLGASGHLSEEAVRQHFELLASRTIAEGASLGISWLPATYQCFDCLSRFETVEQSETVTCPNCSGVALEIAHQDISYVTSIDVE